MRIPFGGCLGCWGYHLTCFCVHSQFFKWHPFYLFLVAASLTMVFPKKGSLLFARVTEQLSIGKPTPGPPPRIPEESVSPGRPKTQSPLHPDRFG